MIKLAKIFISHSVKDKELADALVDLIETGTEISSSDIFCSSLEGLGIPSGKDFIEYIKDQIQKPQVVIVLLSENYLASQFCLCELGAAWALSHSALPLLVPPLKYSDVKGVLLATQINNLEDDSGLDLFHDGLLHALSIQPTKVTRWSAKKRQFLKKLPALLDSLESPNFVSPAEYQELKKNHEANLLLQEEYEDEISELKTLVKDLESCKDPIAINKVKRSRLKGREELFAELQALSTALETLPNIVAFVMYRYHCHQQCKFDSFKEPDTVREAEAAVEDGYLQYDEGFELNANDPAVKKALVRLNTLERYLSRTVSEDVEEEFTEENGYELSLSNKRLWKSFITDGITRY